MADSISTIQSRLPNIPQTHIRNITADGLDVFYREAGSPSAPTILLLHGYPSSSHQYRHLIPLLALHYHVLAPDLPGFGFTSVPESRSYTYTFDNLGTTVSAFLDALDVTSYIVYMFDYGAPVTFRLALGNPTAIKAIVVQNGNAYLQGLGPAFKPISDYYTTPTPATEQVLRDQVITFAGTKMQYTIGAPHPETIEPESYNLDAALLTRPGNVDIQLALFRSYKSNVELYPAFQAYLRKSQVPLLAVWGANDPFFPPVGAEAYRGDLPAAEVKLLDAGHFALETNVEEVAETMLEFLRKL